jgi:hypothetical protein
MARHEPGVGARGPVRVGEASFVCGHRETGGSVPGCPSNIRAWPETVPRGEALAPAAGCEAPAGGFTGPGRPAVQAASASATPSTTPQLTRRLIISLPVTPSSSSAAIASQSTHNGSVHVVRALAVDLS